MNRKLLTLLAGGLLGLVLAVILAFVARGEFAQFFIVVVIVLYGAAPATGVGVLAFIVSKFHKPRLMRWVGTAGLTLALILVLQVLSLPIGYELQEQDTVEARQYCESLIASLNAHQEQTGGYPDTIDQFPSAQNPAPRLIDTARFYSTDGKSFTLRFDVDDGFLSTIHYYDSKTGQWRKFS